MSAHRVETAATLDAPDDPPHPAPLALGHESRTVSGSRSFDDRKLLELHRRYDRDPTPDTREALTHAYGDFALALARRFQRSGEPLEDLQQVALEALLVAFDRFDPCRGVPFKGFAKPTIEGALKRHYRDTGWALRVPRQVHELAGPLRRETERLTIELARTPSRDEVANAMGVDPSDIAATRQALSARAVRSIDTPTRVDGVAVEPAAREHPYERAENHLALVQALGRLDDRERTVLQRYYIDGCIQSDIAHEFGVSQMQISRWIMAATSRLRRYMLNVGMD